MFISTLPSQGSKTVFCMFSFFALTPQKITQGDIHRCAQGQHSTSPQSALNPHSALMTHTTFDGALYGGEFHL